MWCTVAAGAPAQTALQYDFLTFAHRYGGVWIDGARIRHCERKLFDNYVVADHPCGWGRAGFGVGSMKGCALVPDSAINVCGWFGEDADESLQKCEHCAVVAIAGALFHCDC